MERRRRLQTKVQHVKEFGWNVTDPKLRKGMGGKGPLSWGGTTFRFAGARQQHNFEYSSNEFYKDRLLRHDQEHALTHTGSAEERW